MVTLKFSVDAWAVIALRLLIGSPMVTVRRPFWVMLTERSGSDFAAAAERAGAAVRHVEGKGFNHFDFIETLADPQGLLGKLMLEQMQLFGP